MKTWKQRAAEARKEGYLPGNAWELQADRHYQRCFPALVKELGKEYKDFLQVKTSAALDLMDNLIDSGTHPEAAWELARAELFQVPPEEQPQTEEWEIEEGMRSGVKAAGQMLTDNLFDSLRPPRTLPI